MNQLVPRFCLHSIGPMPLKIYKTEIIRIVSSEQKWISLFKSHSPFLGGSGLDWRDKLLCFFGHSWSLRPGHHNWIHQTSLRKHHPLHIQEPCIHCMSPMSQIIFTFLASMVAQSKRLLLTMFQLLFLFWLLSHLLQIFLPCQNLKF